MALPIRFQVPAGASQGRRAGGGSIGRRWQQLLCTHGTPTKPGAGVTASPLSPGVGLGLLLLITTVRCTCLSSYSQLLSQLQNQATYLQNPENLLKPYVSSQPWEGGQGGERIWKGHSRGWLGKLSPMLFSACPGELGGGNTTSLAPRPWPHPGPGPAAYPLYICFAHRWKQNQVLFH